MDHTEHVSKFTELFSQDGFMPHGHCYLWQAPLVWTHVISDTLIGIAYLAISLTLYALVKKIRIQYSTVVLCFGVFIGACGATHFLEVWTLWNPDYWLSGMVKVITALASVGTGIYLFRLRRSIVTVAEAAKLSEQRKVDLEFLTRDLEKRVQERTEEVERGSEQFRAFFELSGFGAAVIDVNTYRFLRVNPQLCKMLGYTEEELKARTFLDITRPKDQARDLEIYEAVKLGTAPHWMAEKQYIKKDGAAIWVAVNGTVIRNQSGRALQSIATIHDITSKKISEAALKESEARFKSLANSIPQLAWVTDPTGHITWYNQRWYDYTGTTLEQMQSEGWNIVHHPEHTQRVTLKWMQHLATGEFWEDTFPLKSKDGSYRWFLSRARLVRDDAGKVLHWFGTNTDITDQLRIEQELKDSKEAAEKANAAKTQFLANMSHEIRTPIGAIMGFTTLLKNPNNTETDVQNFMNIIDRNSQQLLRLIDEILDLSKIEAGKIAIEKTDFSLVELLKDFSSIEQLKANEKGISFQLKIDGQIPDTICTDQTRLKQILSNVIGNAIKFTEHGFVELRVRYKEPVLEFIVTDTGRGISPEQRLRLFQPFEQADPSMSRKYGGSGLGLILSKRLAEALGGTLVIESSELNKGSRFIATIMPAPISAAKMVGSETLGNASPTESTVYNDRPALTGLKILIVEDFPDNRILLSTYLKKAGAQVVMAEDGQAGVEKALNESPDIILMDIQMPVMDGHKAMQSLREQGFTKPIIALTAHAMREEKEGCFESGCTDFMTKPVNRDLLLELLNKYRP